MFKLKHSIHAAAAALVFLGAASAGPAADSKAADSKAADCKTADCKSMPMHHHHDDLTILTLVEKATTSADHAAVAKRYEEQAADYEKQAAEHEKLAAQYRKGPRNPKWNNYADLAVHCDNQAKRMKEAAADAREMAQLHGDVAKMTTPETK